MNTGTGSAPKRTGRTGRTGPFGIPRRTLAIAAAVVVLAVLGGGVGQVFGMVNMGAGVSASNASTAAGATEGLDMNGGVRAAVEDAADQAALAKEEKAADASMMACSKVRPWLLWIVIAQAVFNGY